MARRGTHQATGGSVEIQALEGGHLDLLVEDSIDLVDHIGIDYREAALKMRLCSARS